MADEDVGEAGGDAALGDDGDACVLGVHIIIVGVDGCEGYVD